MEKIERVLLAGAGAIGMLHAAKFARAEKVDFRLAADAARRDRYRREGLFFNGERMDFRFDESEKEFSPQLVIVATKAGQYEEALELVSPRVTPDTIVLPLLNGISASGIARKRFPFATVLDGFFIGHASMRSGTHVRHDGVGTTCIGEAGASGGSSALRAVEELFRRAGIACEVPSDMAAAVWKKFILNVGVNQTSAYFCADYGAIRRDPEKLAFAEKLMLEALAVAGKEKIPVGREAVESGLQVILSMPPDAKTSMLQDVENGRPTEVDLFAGELLRRGKRLGVPTPVNALVLKRFGKEGNVFS